MKTRKRFIRSVIDTAQKTEVEMPWARGTRRKEFIAKRSEQAKLMRRSA